jgi:hypothetical protein
MSFGVGSCDGRNQKEIKSACVCESENEFFLIGKLINLEAAGGGNQLGGSSLIKGCSHLELCAWNSKKSVIIRRAIYGARNIMRVELYI